MIQYSQFCLRMGMELVPETLYSNELTRLCAREDYIETKIYFHSFHIICHELMEHNLLTNEALVFFTV
jgi:hypothetical protein